MQKFARIAAWTITVLISLAYLATALTPYVSNKTFPWMVFPALAYLPVLALFLLTILAWLLVRRKVALILILVLLSGYKSLFATIGVNIFRSGWHQQKAPGALRVMSWNVNLLGSPFRWADTSGSVRRQMLEFIQANQPDILCLQDFAMNEDVGEPRNFVNSINDLLFQNGFEGYHYAFHHYYDGPNYCDMHGVAIFSRLPITNKQSFFKNGWNGLEESAYVDVVYQSKPVRIFTSHFSSMSLWPNTEDEAGIKYLQGDSSRNRAKTITQRLLLFSRFHAQEAEYNKAEMNKSPYPLIFAADINSVPSSYVYHHLKKGLRDAFLQRDFGVGGTYNRIFPKLRIDIMLHSSQLQVIQFTRPAVSWSDHYPIIADFRWKE